MKLKLKDKKSHPMYGKSHDLFALNKISKPGSKILCLIENIQGGLILLKKCLYLKVTVL